jgi:hypothetical protein
MYFVLDGEVDAACSDPLAEGAPLRRPVLFQLLGALIAWVGWLCGASSTAGALLLRANS